MRRSCLLAACAIAVATPTYAATEFYELEPGVTSPTFSFNAGSWLHLDITFSRPFTGWLGITTKRDYHDFENFNEVGGNDIEFFDGYDLIGERQFLYVVGRNSTFNPLTGTGRMNAFSIQGMAQLASGQVPLEMRVITISGGVPEPATWSMLIAGFGVIGAGLRRTQRRKLPFAAVLA